MKLRYTCGILALLLLPTLAWAQASGGRVSGTVRDQTQAVIPGARVLLTNTATNVITESSANEVGFFVFPAVVPGEYRISVEAPGMAKFERSFTVQVLQSIVIDPELTPGATATTVEVEAIAPMVNVDNPTVSSSIERRRVEQMPINGRSIVTLFQLVPGMEGRYAFQAYGARTGSAEVMVDGSAEMDRRWGNPPGIDGTPTNPQGLESIQEFTVLTNAVSAKMSRPTNIIISTKSGTNDLHGTLFWTNRNSGYGVARKREDYYDKAPPLNRNEYGWSAGGPLVIPKVYNGRDRTFWFATWEALKLRQTTTRGWSVPTQAMRNGDFSELRDSQGRLLTLYDPWSTGENWQRQPFAYGGKLNAIDPSRISPIAKYLLGVTPLPTMNTNPNVESNLWGPLPMSHDNWTFTSRFDHRFSDRDSLYVRVNYTDLNYVRDANRGSRIQTADNIYGREPNTNSPKSIAVNWLHTFSPTFFNELLISPRRDNWFGGSFDNGINWVEKFGLPNPFNDTKAPTQQNLGFSNYDYQVNSTKRNHNTFFILDDNLTKVYRNHEFQFGFHGRRDDMNILPDQNPYPYVNYNTNATAVYDPASTPQNPQATPITGHAFANFFLGLGNYDSRFQHRWYYLRTGEYALYFQDNWKVTNRLTLNLGLRWEYWTTYDEKNDSFAGLHVPSKSVVTGADLNTLYNFGATLPSIVNRFQQLGMKFATAADVGLPTNLIYDNRKNFAPRIGFAYRALEGRRQFVIRGGYSLAFFPIPTYFWLDSNRSNPPQEAAFSWNPNSAEQSPDGLANYWLRAAPIYVAGVNSQNALSVDEPRGITRGSAGITFLGPEQPDPRRHSWNLSIEKELMANTVFRVRYVGAHDSHQDMRKVYNNQIPNYVWFATTRQPLPTGEFSNVARRQYENQVLGTIREHTKTGWSNYNGFDFELERRYSKGYAWQFFYTMGNSIGTGGSTVDIASPDQFMPGLVPDDYIERTRLLAYARNTDIPKHRVRWNWLVDLPFGKGKPIGGDVSGVVDKFIGGWQVAGLGSWRTNYFSLPTGNWNLTGEPIRIYGYDYPIQDCTSGVCLPGYLWWNGYIPENKINVPGGYLGIPADYKPAVTPLIPWGSTSLPANAPPNTNISQFWDTNNVWIPLANGQTERVGYSPGLHPWNNQRLPSVRQWTVDASLVKNTNITERVTLRFTADFFNVFNTPGTRNSVGSTGIISTQRSNNDARTVQMGLRLAW